MIAIKRLQNILWILIVAFGALSAYLISLRVATERNAVLSLERRIFAERAQIRYLETEFEARANMRQLERWNSDDYRYVAPAVAQYLPGERALASLDNVPTNGDAYVAPPVMMAMVESEADLPTAAAEKVASPAPAQIRESETQLRSAAAKAAVASTPIRTAAAVTATPVAMRPVTDRKADKAERSAKANAGDGGGTAKAKSGAKSGAKSETGRLASAKPGKTKGPIQLLPPSMIAARPDAARPDAGRPDARARKAERMALLDQTLLDDRTLRDIGSKAAAENRGRKGR